MPLPTLLIVFVVAADRGHVPFLADVAERRWPL